jgi:hypothetical protein
MAQGFGSDAGAVREEKYGAFTRHRLHRIGARREVISITDL